MPDLETVAIHSWKNPQERWVINASDFDPTKHVRWGLADGQQNTAEAGHTLDAANEQRPVSPAQQRQEFVLTDVEVIAGEGVAEGQGEKARLALSARPKAAKKPLGKPAQPAAKRKR